MSDHDPHAAEDNPEVQTQTPKATISTTLVVGIVIFFLFLVMIGKIIMDKKEKEFEPEVAINIAKADFDIVFDMLDVQVGGVLQINLPAETSAKVELLNNGSFPMWSSDHIEIYDDENHIRVVGRDSQGRLTFLQGETSANNIKWLKIKNTQKYSITFKIGYCVSEKNCNINFEQKK